MHHINLDFFTGGLVWTLASYAAQTFPMPESKYAKWILGIIQYGLANRHLGDENFKSAKIDDAFDKLKDKIEDRQNGL